MVSINRNNDYSKGLKKGKLSRVKEALAAENEEEFDEEGEPIKKASRAQKLEQLIESIEYHAESAAINTGIMVTAFNELKEIQETMYTYMMNTQFSLLTNLVAASEKLAGLLNIMIVQNDHMIKISNMDKMRRQEQQAELAVQPQRGPDWHEWAAQNTASGQRREEKEAATAGMSAGEIAAGAGAAGFFGAGLARHAGRVKSLAERLKNLFFTLALDTTEVFVGFLVGIFIGVPEKLDKLMKEHLPSEEIFRRLAGFIVTRLGHITDQISNVVLLMFDGVVERISKKVLGEKQGEEISANVSNTIKAAKALLFSGLVESLQGLKTLVAPEWDMTDKIVEQQEKIQKLRKDLAKATATGDGKEAAILQQRVKDAEAEIARQQDRQKKRPSMGWWDKFIDQLEEGARDGITNSAKLFNDEAVKRFRERDAKDIQDIDKWVKDNITDPVKAVMDEIALAISKRLEVMKESLTSWEGLMYHLGLSTTPPVTETKGKVPEGFYAGSSADFTAGSREAIAAATARTTEAPLTHPLVSRAPITMRPMHAERTDLAIQNALAGSPLSQTVTSLTEHRTEILKGQAAQIAPGRGAIFVNAPQSIKQSSSSTVNLIPPVIPASHDTIMTRSFAFRN